jgi:predicted secreted protein
MCPIAVEAALTGGRQIEALAVVVDDDPPPVATCLPALGIGRQQ